MSKTKKVGCKDKPKIGKIIHEPIDIHKLKAKYPESLITPIVCWP